MTNEQLWKLLLLSLLWGGSFLFIGIAVQELPPLLVVALRVSIAALTMLPLIWILKIQLPTNIKAWMPFLGMGILNNVIPFTAIFYAQTHISVSLASITNSITPLVTFVILAALGGERLTPNKLIGGVLGVLGVAILLDPTNLILDGTTVGILLSLGATISYGFSALWAKKFLQKTSAIRSAAAQLICSSFVMIFVILLLGVDIPSELPSNKVIISVLSLAVLSTALAYMIFFNIIAVSGPSNAMLVTLLAPVSASILGWLVMNDQLTAYQLVGAIVIALALLTIDGRLFSWLHRLRVDP